MWGEHKCGRCGDGAGAIYSVGFFVCSLTKQMECNPGVFSGGYARMAALPLGFRGVCFAPQGGHVARDCPQTPPSRPVVCHRCQQVCVCLGWRQLGKKKEFKQPFSNQQKNVVRNNWPFSFPFVSNRNFGFKPSSVPQSCPQVGHMVRDCPAPGPGTRVVQGKLFNVYCV